MRKPLRILQIVPSLEMGGVEQGTIDTAMAIQKSGNIPFVVSSGGKLTKQLDENYIQHITLPVNTKNPLLIFMNIFLLSIVIFLKKIDIVHARSRAPAWSAYIACILTGTRFVTTFHGFYSGYNSWIKNKYNSVMTYGDKIIVPSHFMKDHIKKYYKISPDKIITIYRGINTKHFLYISKERVNKLKKKYKLETVNKKIIVLPGRLTEWKGQELLIETAKSISNQDYFYILVGKGSQTYLNRLKQHIRKYGLDDQFFIDEHCDDIPALYHLADIILSLSKLEETFGRVAVEAQASGSTILASNIGGSLETVVDGVSGKLFKNGDIADLKKNLIDILENNVSFRVEAVKNSKRFDIEVFNKKIIDFYKNL